MRTRRLHSPLDKDCFLRFRFKDSRHLLRFRTIVVPSRFCGVFEPVEPGEFWQLFPVTPTPQQPTAPGARAPWAAVARAGPARRSSAGRAGSALHAPWSGNALLAAQRTRGLCCLSLIKSQAHAGAKASAARASRRGPGQGDFSSL